MEAFVDVFFKIDTDYDEKITMRDLESYVRKNNLDSGMVQKWSNLFDKNNSGNISLTEFCDTLGLKLAEIRTQRAPAVQHSAPGGLRSDVRVVMATMGIRQQIEVSEEVFRLLQERNPRDEHIAGRIKKYMDSKYGRSWQVVVTKGSSWAGFTHLPETAFFFQLHDFIYLIWKTPE